MKRVIANTKKEQFVRGLLKRLIQYGIGRPVSFTDYTMLDKLVADCGKENFKARDLIKRFILSKAFSQK